MFPKARPAPPERPTDNRLRPGWSKNPAAVPPRRPAPAFPAAGGPGAPACPQKPPNHALCAAPAAAPPPADKARPAGD